MLHTFAVFKGREKKRKEERRKERIVKMYCVLATSIMHIVHFLSKRYKKFGFGNVVFMLKVNILASHHKLLSTIILTLFTDPSLFYYIVYQLSRRGSWKQSQGYHSLCLFYPLIFLWLCSGGREEEEMYGVGEREKFEPERARDEKKEIARWKVLSSRVQTSPKAKAQKHQIRAGLQYCAFGNKK